ARRMAIDPTGWIAVVGSGVVVNGPNTFSEALVAALFKPDGSPDVNFGTGGKVTTGALVYPAGAAFDAAGRLVVAGYSWSDTTGSGFTVARFLGHDPVVEAGSATFAADLQSAVAALRASPPPGTPRVVIHAANQAQLTAALSALANLPAQTS